MLTHLHSRWFICFPKLRFSDQRKTPQWQTGLCPNNKKARKPWFHWLSDSLEAGDERIELPPKVLETPIIPFDQSPTKYILYTLKTTYMLTFPWDSLLPALLSEWSTPRWSLRDSVSQRFGQALTRLVTVSSMHYCTSTSALSTSSSSRGFTSFEWDISS